MRMIIVACSIALLAAAPAGAKLVSAGFGKSWGKPGVSLEQYRADAVACGRQAASLDLSWSNPARALVLASRLIDNAADIQAAGDALRIASPERNVAKAGDLIHSALDHCLVEHGYRQFRLTGEQRHRLAKLPTGSIERHTYLHSLASDPVILASQAVD